MKGLLRKRPGLRSEDGLSLIEAVISISVLMFVALGLTQTMIAGYRALRTTKTVQQATAVGDETIEAARALAYDALSHNTTDTTLASDTEIKGNADCPGLTGTYFFDPDGWGTGTLDCEKLVYSTAGGGIDLHVNTAVTVGSENYTVKQYATWVDGGTQGGTAESYKRVVVIVSWEFGDQTKTYRSSTLITGNTHGVPIVDFEITPATSNFSVFAGEQVVYSHTVRNLGIPESFDLSLPNPAGYTWTKTFYRDVNANDTYEAGTDTALTDTNGNGTIDTGTLATDASIDILEVWTTSSGDAAGTPVLTLTATPFSDATAAKSVSLNLTVTAGAPPQLQLWLHNTLAVPTGNTTAQKPMFMDDVVPTATTLYNYATDVYTGDGRAVEEGTPSASESDVAEMANWVWQAPVTLTLEGTMTLHVNLQLIPDNKGKCNQGDWDFFVRKKSSSTTDSGTLIAQDKKNKDSGCASQWVDETITIPRTTLAADEWLEVKVMTDKTKGAGIWFNYDTTTYDAYVIFPQVAARF